MSVAPVLYRGASVLFFSGVFPGPALSACSVDCPVLSSRVFWIISLQIVEEGMPTAPVFLPGESMDCGALWATVLGVAESATAERSAACMLTQPLNGSLPFPLLK